MLPSSSSTTQSIQPVQFVGAWETDDRTLILNVIRRVECAISGSGASRDPWEPWVALQHVLDQDDCYFTAHRLQHDKVVVARSAQELANKISAIAS